MLKLRRLRAACALACLCALTLPGCSRIDSAPVGAPARTTITALIWAPDWPGEMQQLAADFTRQNPDVRVNLQFMIGNSVEENIKPKVAAHNLPDLMSVNPNAYAAELADQGVLADLSQTAAWPNMLDSLKDDWTSRSGKHFGIAGGVAATLMYYNKTMFAQAGVTTLPANFDEFLAVCAKLKRAGFIPIMWSGGYPNSLGNGPFSFGFANNVVARHSDWKARIAAGTLNLDTSEAADIFGKIRLVAARGFVQPGYMNTGYDEGIRMFSEGKTAMEFNGTWASAKLMHGAGFQTGVFIPPWNAPGKTVVPVIGSETGFAVCETGNKAAATRFLEFIVGRGFSTWQNKRQSIVPLKHVDGPVVSDPQLTAYIDKIGRYPVTASPYYSILPANTIEMLHPLIQDVLYGKTSPAKAAKLLDASIRLEAQQHNK